MTPQLRNRQHNMQPKSTVKRHCRQSHQFQLLPFPCLVLDLWALLSERREGLTPRSHLDRPAAQTHSSSEFGNRLSAPQGVPTTGKEGLSSRPEVAHKNTESASSPPTNIPYFNSSALVMALICCWHPVNRRSSM